jgi:hypothetical protein
MRPPRYPCGCKGFCKSHGKFIQVSRLLKPLPCLSLISKIVALEFFWYNELKELIEHLFPTLFHFAFDLIVAPWGLHVSISSNGPPMT